MLFDFIHIVQKNHKKMKFFQYRTFLECALFHISCIIVLFFFIDLVLELGFHRYVALFLSFFTNFLIMINLKFPKLKVSN